MIRIELDDRQAQSALAELARRGADLAPALADIGKLLVASTKGRFAQGTSPEGTPWAPNSPVTMLRYLGRCGGSFSRRGGRGIRGAGRRGGDRD